MLVALQICVGDSKNSNRDTYLFDFLKHQVLPKLAFTVREFIEIIPMGSCEFEKLIKFLENASARRKSALEL